MSIKPRFTIALAVVFLLLAGCATNAAELPPETEALAGSTVSTQMQYLYEFQSGPVYDVELTVPDEWVGAFEVRDFGNILYFDYIEGDQRAPLFSIEALSREQYWKASGSYPGSQLSIVNENDTHFVYSLPIDAYYSGLPEATFAELSAIVPEVISSFTSTPVQ